MPLLHHVSNVAKALMTGSTNKYIQFCALAMLTYDVQALTPSQVFDKVKESVVVVTTLDANGKTIAQGSGVLLPSGKIGTNCHVVKSGTSFHVGSGKRFVLASVWGSDEGKDICLLEAKGLSGKAAQLGQASRLKVGEPVYAVGAPRGLELSLSDGIVSQLRGGPPPFIQTTAAISPGSSGGGLFDAEGQLVGFTTLFIEGGQSLNFAMPVEWVGEIQPGNKAAQGRSEGDWIKRAIAFHDAENWTRLMDWCQQWTRAQPENGFAWSYFGAAYSGLQRHTEAIEAYRQFARIDPKNARAWFFLGGEYRDLQRYSEAIGAYRQSVRIDPKYVNAWFLLVVTYEESGNRTEALKALSQLRRIDPAKADELLSDLTAPQNVASDVAAAGWVAVTVGANATIYANPATIRKDGNIVKMWDLHDFKTENKVEGKPYMSIREQAEYDCKEEQRRLRFASWHSGKMGEGETVYSVAGSTQLQPVSPGAINEFLWKFACGKK